MRQHIVIESDGRSMGITRGWRDALAYVRTGRRMYPGERWSVRGATVRDLMRLSFLD